MITLGSLAVLWSLKTMTSKATA